MKNNFLILYFLLSAVLSPAQNKHIDSLQNALKNAVNDSSKARLMNSISRNYQSVDKLKAFDFANQALSVAEKTNAKSVIGDCYNNLGDLYWYSGDYTTSSDYYFKALKIFEEINDLQNIAESYRNIGWIYMGQTNYTLTLKYYLKSLDLNERLNLKQKIIANYDDLGIVYKLMGKYQEAMDYCQKTIALAKQTGSKKGVATGTGNLGALYYAIGKYDLAIENYSLSNKTNKELKDHYNIAEDYFGLSDCYAKLNKPDSVIKYADEALIISKQFNYKTEIGTAYHKLSEGYFAKKDFLKAYSNLRLFTEIQDSTYNEKNSSQINEMSAKYESEKKELTINALEKGKAEDRKFRIYLIMFSFIIVAFAIILFRGNIQKKNANASLSLAYKEIEVKNKDINDSINYAKQIQRARLPNPANILKVFPQAFGLYKPKDVVSGDFYWFAMHENGNAMLAAADCTGHGIPGAFMSMIGIDELNHATLEKRLSDTSDILSLVNVSIKKALRQNEENSMSRDGMDIALCVFDLENNSLQYSGANRPLYYIRDNQLNEILPTKAAIGGTTSNDQEFKSHTISIQKNDMIYLFTDGFADQFGGPDGKKFMTKKFKDLLLSIHTKPIDEQELILETTLEQWKHNNSQVDDVLVIGVRI